MAKQTVPSPLVNSSADAPATVPELAALALALIGEPAGLTDAEVALVASGVPAPSSSVVRRARSLVAKGHDPLGDAYCAIRSPEQRRPMGQTYTPAPIIKAMVNWATDQGTPTRIVDPGAGSGRYLLAAGKRFPRAELHAAEIDPLAVLMLRANAAAAGLSDRLTVHLGDYRALQLPEGDGSTLFIGNPPYVRHHLITQEWKAWLLDTAASRGLDASGLAGLHVHFFLATAVHGRPGDFGTFITSSEWLDVNYGKLVRQLLLDGLDGESLHVIDPSAAPFADATTTGAITCFRIGDNRTKMKVRAVESMDDLGRLAKGHPVSRERMAETSRWSLLTRSTPSLPEGYVELGEFCRVHRGAVTGANRMWVQAEPMNGLPPEVLFPTVTKAKELFTAGASLTSTDALKLVIDLPVDLNVFDGAERKAIDELLRIAKREGVDQGYVATNRRAWWSVGLREPAPILATYMARRPPAFVRNQAQARHINIAHGLYPRDPMTNTDLDSLALFLRHNVSLSGGRTYAGGLTKFEPREMERLAVPGLDLLRSGSWDAAGAAAALDGQGVY